MQFPRLSRISPPPTVLDRALYSLVLTIPAARVPCSLIPTIRDSLPKDSLLALPRLKGILPCPEHPKSRLFLLSHKLGIPLPDSIGSVFTEHECPVLEHALVLDYAYWQTEDILAASLPPGLPVPSSFEVVGHLAHLNLIDELIPYRHLIGQVILDKNPAISTVVSKIGTIDSTFRFFEMDLLAGKRDFNVSVRESGCEFRFDYSRVYWNSRLQGEHERLVKMVGKGDAVFDVFAGVGPFAIPASKKGANVFANDLNPASYECLTTNAKRNKVKISASNLDGREFIRESFSSPLSSKRHYIMNLPALAASFCDAFNEMPESLLATSTIHCHLFVRTGEDSVELIQKHLANQMNCEIVHNVRNVAPNKDMYCVTFTLGRNKRSKID